MIDPRQLTENAEENAQSCASVAQKKLGDKMPIMSEVRLIGGALVMILLIVFVLTEIYDAIEIEEGPFTEVADSLESIGATALVLLVLALLVVAASAIMRFFGSSGFGGR